MNLKIFSVILVFISVFYSCNSGKKKKSNTENPAELTFESRQLVDDARWWWAVTIGDITGDGLADVVFIDNNSSGGDLGFRTGQKGGGIWQTTIIADEAPGGGDFASGDLEIGDMDGDGDLDVLAVKHTGEWDDAGAEAELFWYKNPEWQPHKIGTVPDAVKDISLADFNNDKRLDLAVITFDEHSLSIFQQNIDNTFSRVKFMKVPNLHEGMDVGDYDADGYTDIFANGYCFVNPGGTLENEWRIEIIDRKWHNQSGDWSQNATKHFCVDLNDDGKTEVFISHSERNGYPVSWYERTEDAWVEHVVTDSLSSCHTLQVFDFDLDGDYDVLAGSNAHRAVNIGKTNFPVTLFINDGSNKNWTPSKIEDGGIYNGRVADFEGDGDYDIFRLPGHEATEYFLLENEIK